MGGHADLADHITGDRHGVHGVEEMHLRVGIGCRVPAPLAQ